MSEAAAVALAVDAAASMSDEIDVLVASAMVAAQSMHNGSSVDAAAKAGASAAASVAGGASLQQVQAQAQAAVIESPGWSLESWLSSLNFDRLVSEAILKRVRAYAPEGVPVQAYEQSFILKLGEARGRRRTEPPRPPSRRTE